MESATVNMTAKQADLVEAVLARPDADDALEYVLSINVGGPSCSCGADHWSCDWSPDDAQ